MERPPGTALVHERNAGTGVGDTFARHAATKARTRGQATGKKSDGKNENIDIEKRTTHKTCKSEASCELL